MDRILKKYYDNNAKKLHDMSDKILRKFGGLSDKDYQDFYSLANEVFVDVMKRYDKKQSFDGFLYSCLSNKFKSEITRLNRQKRQADKNSISIDAPKGDSNNLTVGDTLQSEFNIEKEVFGDKEEGYSEKMLQYLNRLSEVQRSVLNLIVAGYSTNEIMEELHITSKQYADCNAAIHSYRNISVLY